MNRLLIVAILMLSTAPLYARAQQPDAAKLNADAQNAVGIIGADKGKTQTYCQIVDLLRRQLERPDQGKDKKKTKALSTGEMGCTGTEPTVTPSLSAGI